MLLIMIAACLKHRNNILVYKHQYLLSLQHYYVKKIEGINRSNSNVPPVLSEDQERDAVEACDVVVADALELVLGVVELVDQRRDGQHRRETNAEDDVVAGERHLLHLLNDGPADVEDGQVDLLNFRRLPDDAADFKIQKGTSYTKN